jgi:hypothetical protein
MRVSARTCPKLCGIALAAVLSLPSIRADVPQGDRAVGETSGSGEFVFARLRYDSIGGWGEAYYNYDGRTWERWETDYPQADENFTHRLTQLSAVVPQARGTTRRLTDPDVFDFPFLYICDPGYMRLSAEEKARLRQYLINGGFVWIDDFWGEGEWWNVEAIMSEVLPEYPWRELPGDHPLLHEVFDLNAAPQVPARDFAVQGWTTDPPWIHRSPAKEMEPVHLRGYFDADGRLMAVATHNSDIGDGFEREAYGQWYFENYSTRAYMMGVNIVVYAMSH